VLAKNKVDLEKNYVLPNCEKIRPSAVHAITIMECNNLLTDIHLTDILLF